ncbi:hypothetical protein JCM10908_003561 [Rhodotorula pacifica]|uniref:uncharacterized protein n=1 Tax=Rhodotorula pacifica TaxID=1495444 RepID=UPI00317DA6DA
MQASTSQSAPAKPPSRPSSASSRRLPATWADSAPKRTAAPASSDPWSTLNHDKKRHKAASWKGKERAGAVSVAGRDTPRASSMASSAGDSGDRVASVTASTPRYSDPAPHVRRYGRSTVSSLGVKAAQPYRAPPSDSRSAIFFHTNSSPRLRVVPQIGTPLKKLPHPTRGPAPLEDLFGEHIFVKPPSRSPSSAPTFKSDPSDKPSTISAPSTLFVPREIKKKPLFPKAIYSNRPDLPRRPKSPPKFEPVEKINEAVREATIDVTERYGTVADRRAELRKAALPTLRPQSPSLSPSPSPPAPAAVIRRAPSPELFEGVHVDSMSMRADDAEDGDVSEAETVERSVAHSLQSEPAQAILAASALGPFSFPLKNLGAVVDDGSGGEVIALRRSGSSTSLSSLDRHTAKKTVKASNLPAKASSSRLQKVKARKHALGVQRSFAPRKAGAEEEWYDIDCDALAPKGSAPERSNEPSPAALPTAERDLKISISSLTVAHSTYAKLPVAASGRVVLIAIEITTSTANGNRLLRRVQREFVFIPTKYQDDPAQTGGLRRLILADSAPISVRVDEADAAALRSASLAISLEIEGTAYSAVYQLDALLKSTHGQLDLAENGYLNFDVALNVPDRVVRTSTDAAHELAARIKTIALQEELPDGVWIPDPIHIRGHAAPKEINLPSSIPGELAFDFATRLPYKPGDSVPFLADETAESMKSFIRVGDAAISRSTVPVKEKLIARMQMRWSLVNPYPHSSYLRELACWRYYAPLVHHFSLRLELALHLIEHLLNHHLLTEPELRTILHAYDKEVSLIAAGRRMDYGKWAGGGPSQAGGERD